MERDTNQRSRGVLSLENWRTKSIVKLRSCPYDRLCVTHHNRHNSQFPDPTFSHLFTLINDLSLWTFTLLGNEMMMLVAAAAAAAAAAGGVLLREKDNF